MQLCCGRISLTCRRLLYDLDLQNVRALQRSPKQRAVTKGCLTSAQRRLEHLGLFQAFQTLEWLEAKPERLRVVERRNFPESYVGPLTISLSLSIAGIRPKPSRKPSKDQPQGSIPGQLASSQESGIFCFRYLITENSDGTLFGAFRKTV